MQKIFFIRIFKSRISIVETASRRRGREQKKTKKQEIEYRICEKTSFSSTIRFLTSFEIGYFSIPLVLFRLYLHLIGFFFRLGCCRRGLLCTRDTHNIIKSDDDDCLRAPRPIINELSEFISIIT